MEYKINHHERSALKGLPYLPRLVYLEALRPYMDYQTGIVGIKRGISYQSIREELYVEPHPGYKGGSPSRSQVRRSVEHLVKTSVISNHSTEKKLIIMCDLATWDYCAQNQVGTKAAHQADTKVTHLNPLNSMTRSEFLQKADIAEMAQAGIPPVSGNNKHSLSKQNEKLTKIDSNFQPSEKTIVKAIDHGCVKAANRDELLNFISYHQAKGTVSQNWDADFLRWCLRGKSYQQQGAYQHAKRNSRQKPHARNAGVSSAVERVVNANQNFIDFKIDLDGKVDNLT